MLKASQLTFDVASLKVGDWVRYRQNVEGISGAGHVRYACVAREGGEVWIEIKGPDRILKQKLDRSGKLLETWTGGPGVLPTRVQQSPEGVPSPRPRRDSSAAREKTLTAVESLTVAGRGYACTKITTLLTYPDGRESRMVNWYAKEVPFGGADQGGLVQRKLGRFTMTLEGHGTDARPELPLPARAK